MGLFHFTFSGLEIEPKASPLLGKCSTTGHSPPSSLSVIYGFIFFFFLRNLVIAQHLEVSLSHCEEHLNQTKIL